MLICYYLYKGDFRETESELNVGPAGKVPGMNIIHPSETDSFKPCDFLISLDDFDTLQTMGQV